MTNKELNLEMAFALGWTQPDESCWRDPDGRDWQVMHGWQTYKDGTDILPDWAGSLDDSATARRCLINTLDLKIAWVNALRVIVGRRCDRRNKAGDPLVSDLDLLSAEPGEITEAILVAIKKAPLRIPPPRDPAPPKDLGELESLMKDLKHVRDENGDISALKEILGRLITWTYRRS